MNLTPEWVSAGCAVIAVLISIAAYFKASGASNKVNALFAQNANVTDLKMGSQKIKGDNNKTATGSGNTIS
jgi:hypothetical protein